MTPTVRLSLFCFFGMSPCAISVPFCNDARSQNLSLKLPLNVWVVVIDWLLRLQDLGVQMARSLGGLSDVAPTVLDLMGLEVRSGFACVCRLALLSLLSCLASRVLCLCGVL
jgi:hypothetical protein